MAKKTVADPKSLVEIAQQLHESRTRLLDMLQKAETQILAYNFGVSASIKLDNDSVLMFERGRNGFGLYIRFKAADPQPLKNAPMDLRVLAGKKMQELINALHAKAQDLVDEHKTAIDALEATKVDP